MAKQVAVRLVSEGGQELKAVFQGIGKTGEDSFRKIGLATKSAESSAEVFEQAMRKDQQQVERLRASLDPLYRSSMQYASALDEINDSLARGLLTQQQATRLTDLAARQYLGAAEGIEGASRAARTGNPAMRNFSLQLSQVAQQGAVTGNYMSALGVQLPDMLIGFGTLGALIGAAAAVLAPFAIELLKTEDAMTALSKEVETLEQAMSALQSANAAAAAPLRELIPEYRQFTDQAREILAVQREIAALDALSSLSAASGQISTVFGSLQDLSGAREEVQRGFEGFQNTVKDLAKDFGISQAQATALAESLRAVGQADGPEEQAAALRAAREQIELAAGGLGEMDDETREVYQSLLDAELTAARLAAIDMASNVGAAADEAGRFANNMAAAMAAQRGDNLAVQYGLYDQGRRAAVQLQREESALYGGDGDVLTEHKARLARAAGTGRSGGGVSAARKEQTEQMRAAERIIESTRTEMEKYNASVAEADKLLADGLITQETYNRHMADLGEELRNMDGFKAIREGIENVSDAIADAIVNGEDLGESMRNIFQQIARDLISSGIRSLLLDTFDLGTRQRRSGGGFGALLGSLFSFEGGGDTPDGPRTGGVDGRGGFLAVLHPNERVTDKSRGSAGSAISVDVRTYVDQDGNWQSRVEQISGMVAGQRIASAQKHAVQRQKRA